MWQQLLIRLSFKTNNTLGTARFFICVLLETLVSLNKMNFILYFKIIITFIIVPTNTDCKIMQGRWSHLELIKLVHTYPKKIHVLVR